MKRLIHDSRYFCQQHGDEGAGNFIFADNGEIYTIDNEKVANRAVEEGIAKFLCWFGAIHSNSKEVIFRVRDGKFIIRFRIHISLPMRGIIARARDEITKQLRKNPAIEIQKNVAHAYCAMYYFREIEWSMRRGRYYIKPYLFCLGIQELKRALGL